MLFSKACAAPGRRLRGRPEPNPSCEYALEAKRGVQRSREDRRARLRKRYTSLVLVWWRISHTRVGQSLRVRCATEDWSRHRIAARVQLIGYDLSGGPGATANARPQGTAGRAHGNASPRCLRHQTFKKKYWTKKICLPSCFSYFCGQAIIIGCLFTLDVALSNTLPFDRRNLGQVW